MFRRIELPYKLNHLEPFISQGTMNLHYNFHHKVYENNLNEALEKFPNLWKANSLEDLISKVDDLPLELRKSVRDFGGGLLNHNFFFSILINNDNSDEKFIDSRLFKQIEKDFGSFNNFKSILLQKSISVFGSGWSWVVFDASEKILKIITTPNQDSPVSFGLIPLIGIDVWEHAYYLDYNGNRSKYLEGLVNNLLNWKLISEIYVDLIDNF